MYNQDERAKLERTIIGGILLEGKFTLVNHFLEHTDFKKPNHLIYTAFVRLYEANEPIDLRTVYRLLEKKKQPIRAHYLIECMSYVNLTANIYHHCMILLEYKLEDDMILACNKYLSSNNIDAQLASNCLQKIAEFTDPLKSLGLITAYLHKRSPESLLTKSIINLNKTFDEKCHRIRQKAI